MTEDDIKAAIARTEDLVKGCNDPLEHAIRADVRELVAEVRRLRANTDGPRNYVHKSMFEQVKRERDELLSARPELALEVV